MLGLQRIFSKRKSKAYDQAGYSETANVEPAICTMVYSRHAVNRRWLKGQSAEQKRDSEFLIDYVVDYCETLHDDGCAEDEIIRKLLSFVDSPPKSCAPDLVSYLRFCLKEIDPEYLSLGDDNLNQAIAIANIAAKRKIERRKLELHTPSDDWLCDKISYDELLSDTIYDEVITKGFHSLNGKKALMRPPRYFVLPFSKSESPEWVRFQLRMKPDDEIWTFRTPRELRSPCQTGGVLLFRSGKLIERVNSYEAHFHYEQVN